MPSGQLPDQALPVAVLAIELSVDTATAPMIEAASRFFEALASALPANAVFRRLRMVTVAMIVDRGLEAAATAAAAAAVAVEAPPAVARRVGIAAGVASGSRPLSAPVALQAARLARAAEPGQALCTYGVARLLDREWELRPTGVVARRQEDAPERAVALVGRKQRAGAASALHAVDQGVLIGRVDEAAWLDDQLAAAQAGDARWCLLAAAAGAGKSTLLRSWLSRVQGAGRIAAAAASPFGQPPLGLVDDLLGGLGAARGASSNAVDVADLIRRRVASSDRPVLLVVDDLHWSDQASLEVLRALSEHRPSRCLVVIAVRSSFASSLDWLSTVAERMDLRPLNRADREHLLAVMLPGDESAERRRQLLGAADGENPLFLQQAAALMREAGLAAQPPATLHEAIMRRLELLERRVSRLDARLDSAAVAAAERMVGEWLDRLEATDPDDRATVAEYLRLLENVDAALVIAGSIVGVPQQRNRRLAATIERFYSASYVERVSAIERLAERDATHALATAAVAAQRALASVRMQDARGYLRMAAGLATGEQRAEHLVQLGEACFLLGELKAASACYEDAMRCSGAARLAAPCQRRLARAALVGSAPERAAELLAAALPLLPAREQVFAQCDLMVATAALGGPISASLADLTETEEEGMRPLVLRSRLRVDLLKGRDVAALARECGEQWVLETDAVASLATLVETTVLLRQAAQQVVSPELQAEAIRAARQLGNRRAEAALQDAARGQPLLYVHPSL